jgi:hypothetical protein
LKFRSAAILLYWRFRSGPSRAILGHIRPRPRPITARPLLKAAGARLSLLHRGEPQRQVHAGHDRHRATESSASRIAMSSRSSSPSLSRRCELAMGCRLPCLNQISFGRTLPAADAARHPASSLRSATYFSSISTNGTWRSGSPGTYSGFHGPARSACRGLTGFESDFPGADPTYWRGPGRKQVRSCGFRGVLAPAACPPSRILRHRSDGDV